MALADAVCGSRRSGRLTAVERLALLVGRRSCQGEHRASAGAGTFESARDRRKPGRKGLWCHRRLARAVRVLNTAHAVGTEAAFDTPAEPDECWTRSSYASAGDSLLEP
jgi:hypothetical protein